VNYYILVKLIKCDFADLRKFLKFIAIPVVITCILIGGGDMLLDMDIFPVYLCFNITIAVIFMANYVLKKE
jgi:hypothetical protein